MEATIMGYIGIIGILWDYIGIMEKKMEATIGLGGFSVQGFRIEGFRVEGFEGLGFKG